MELNKSEFKNAVSRISAAIPKKSIIQNLCNVLFESKDGIVKLTGSDMNHICHTEFKAEGVEDVSFTVNCEKLKKALAMRGDKITINYFDEGNEHITISNGTTTVELDCLKVSDYPVFNTKETTNTRKVSAKALVDIVNKVKFSASTDGSRKSLTGVYIKFTENEMQIFCTDGKRIAYGSEDCKELISNDSFGFNLPMKSVEIINNLNTVATQNEDKTWNEPEVVINYSGETVEFFQDDFSTISKVITELPPVDSILGMVNEGKIFTEPTSSFKTSTSDMSGIVRFINSLCDAESGMKITRKENKVHFSVKNGTQIIDDEMEVENIKDGEVEINCKICYMLEPLVNFGVENVVFEFGGSGPFFIIADKFKYILMPMRA